MTTTEQLITNKQVQEALDKRDLKKLRLMFKDSELADIAEICSDLSILQCIVLLRLIPRSQRATMFSHMEIERQQALIDELPDIIVTSLLNEMEPDDRTRILEDLPPEIQQKILVQLDPKEQQDAWRLLSYPEESVGRLMTLDFLTLKGDLTVTEALEKIHWSTALPEEYLQYLFVTNNTEQLIGEISLAALVTCDPRTRKLCDIMRKSHVYLSPYHDNTEAVENFRKYERNYIPVIDNKRKLLGIVTADDVFDVAEDEATEDIQQFGGHAALEEGYFHTSFFTMIKKRFGWLAILFLSGFISAEALRNYEEVLAKWSFIVFFLPIVTSTGGNSGTQIASLIIRGIAIKEMALTDVWRVLIREIPIAISLGLLLALIGFTGVITWGLGIKTGIIISLSIISVVILGVICGSMLPFVFERLKLDPAVVSSPFISTLLDVSGIVVYLNIALVVMNW